MQVANTILPTMPISSVEETLLYSGPTMRSQPSASTILRTLSTFGSLVSVVFAPARATNLRFLPIGGADTLEYVSIRYSLTEGYPPTGSVPTQTFRQFGLRQLGSDSLVVSRQNVDSANSASSEILLDTLLVKDNFLLGRTFTYELPDTIVETRTVVNGSYDGMNRYGIYTIFITTTTAKSCRIGALKTGVRFLVCKTTVEQSATDGNSNTSATGQYFLEGVGEISYSYNWRIIPASTALLSRTYGVTSRKLTMRAGQTFPWETYVSAIDSEVVAGVTRSASRKAESAYRFGLLANPRFDVLGRTGAHSAIPFFLETDRPRAKVD